jgi:hypothetical protein
MKFQVGRFTCKLSINHRGEVEAEWRPRRPRYLNKEERMQYRRGRTAFLERINPGSVVDVVDQLSSTDAQSRKRTQRNAEGVRDLMIELAGQSRQKAHACKHARNRRALRRRLGRIPVRNARATAIPLALPSLQAVALTQFVKRVDFEMVARCAAVTVVCDDGKSEADLIWLALIALRSALEVGIKSLREGDIPCIPCP